MRLPSLKTLEEAFPGKGRELRELLEKKRKTTDYKSVRDWEAQCYHRPGYRARLLLAINEILEGHGVEPLWGRDYDDMWPVAEYINMGDTYNVTILMDHERGTICVTDWGTFVEKNERRLRK